MRSLLASLSLLLAAFTVSVTAQEKAWEPKPRARSFPWMSYADWNSMHDAMLRRALQGDVDVLFLGDSITQGWADNAVWKQRYVLRKPANFGIGGDTTQNVLWRIENGALVGIDPKVVVLLIGTNNLGIHDDSPDDVAKLFSIQRVMYESGATPQDISMLMEMALGGSRLRLEDVVGGLRSELQRRLGPADIINIIELAEAFQV